MVALWRCLNTLLHFSSSIIVRQWIESVWYWLLSDGFPILICLMLNTYKMCCCQLIGWPNLASRPGFTGCSVGRSVWSCSSDCSISSLLLLRFLNIVKCRSINNIHIDFKIFPLYFKLMTIWSVLAMIITGISFDFYQGQLELIATA